MMRRGWIIAGALILAAVPSVPVAAAGVSLVLERVNGSDGAGKWVRTGDTQRFRVRLNGMAKGAKVAVAASPVEALSEVACAPSRATRPAATPAPASAAAAAPSATAATAATGATGAAPATGMGAAVTAGAAKTAPLSAIGSAGSGSVASGAAAGGARVGGATAAAGALAVHALAVVGTPAFTSTVMPGTRVCTLGNVSGEQAVDVTLTAPAGAKKVVLAAAARMRSASGDGLTTMSKTAVSRVRGAVTGEAATFTGQAVRVQPKHGNSAGAQAAKVSQSAGAGSAGTGSTGIGSAGAESAGTGLAGQESAGVADSGGLTLPRAAPQQTLPAVSPQALTGAPEAVGTPGVPEAGTMAGAPAAGSAPSVPAPLDAEAARGIAPLPWEVAASAKRMVRPAGGASPLEGPKGLPVVAGGIGVLLGALWWIGTVQRGRKGRKVL
ncbi:hypothetical protein ACFLIM_12250 [Nonomuraea sp. M3C6]|uniref:Uncharacterized protein n=1 Tax=Nonomuraea marmarensis TaxID=3351344 RepID=A0ABW7A9D7_9ACTN